MAKQTVKTNGNAPSAPTEASAKKRQSSKSFYVNADGTQTRSPTKDTVTVGFLFEGFDNDPVLTQLADLSDAIKTIGLAQGINIKEQRSYNTAETPADMKEACEATRDNLLNGVWIGEREKGGLRISDLVEAIVRQMVNVEGETVDDARRAGIKAKLSDSSEAGEKLREKYRNNVDVKKQLVTIEAEKLAAKTAAINAVASTGETVGADF